MTYPENERLELLFAKDISLTDVERLESFLTARTARLARAERGSDERQLARSVRRATLHLATTLRHFLAHSEPDDDLRIQIMLSWNALWALVSPWQWHGDYDHERWRPVKRWDAIAGV
ncbi:hypothetical protein ACFY41_26145 [Streptomyces syringium]|uniref:hypothetical protein n=1 Tax=Streptomyces syringium TaxID=76729 RepID=UPI00368395DB